MSCAVSIIVLHTEVIIMVEEEEEGGRGVPEEERWVDVPREDAPRV